MPCICECKLPQVGCVQLSLTTQKGKIQILKEINLKITKRHSALLHKKRQPPPISEPTWENNGENPKCTTLCSTAGSVSCSKTLLVNVYSKTNPRLSTQLYTVADKQSNSSLVTCNVCIRFGTGQSSTFETKSIFCRSIWQARSNRTAGRLKCLNRALE